MVLLSPNFYEVYIVGFYLDQAVSIPSWNRRAYEISFPILFSTCNHLDPTARDNSLATVFNKKHGLKNKGFCCLWLLCTCETPFIEWYKLMSCHKHLRATLVSEKSLNAIARFIPFFLWRPFTLILGDWIV